MANIRSAELQPGDVILWGYARLGEGAVVRTVRTVVETVVTFSDWSGVEQTETLTWDANVLVNTVAERVS